jgi:hypothetical protein
MIPCANLPTLLLWMDTLLFDELGIGLLADLVSTAAIVLLIYRPTRQHADYVFTFFVFNLLIFFLCSLMVRFDLGAGFAFGLFALFSIMRLRTSAISTKDMTYLFSVICLGIFNAMKTDGEFPIIVVDVLIVGALFVLERFCFRDALSMVLVNYENIALINEGRWNELREDLEKRTGFHIEKVQVETIDYLNDSAKLIVYYKPVGDRFVPPGRM